MSLVKNGVHRNAPNYKCIVGLVLVLLVGCFSYMGALNFRGVSEQGTVTASEEFQSGRNDASSHVNASKSGRVRARQRTIYARKHSRNVRVLQYYAQRCTVSYFTGNDAITPVSSHRSPRGPRPWNSSELAAVDPLLQDVLELPIPEEFHPDFANPCWYTATSNGSRTRTLRCLPYFFLAGFPKCGTTDLYLKIALHPQIQLADVKETHWWTRNRFGDMPCKENGCSRNPRRTFNVYVTKFNTTCLRILSDLNVPKPIELITGDASASTIWDNRFWRFIPGNAGFEEPRVLVAHQIRHYLPDSKIIVIMRDPVERMFSDFLYFWPNKTAPKPEIFHQKMAEAVASMTECLRTRPERQCAYTVNSSLARLQIGLYSVFVKDWLQIFNRSQIHFLRTEDYKVDPLGELNNIYRFLGLGTFPDTASDLVRNLPRTNRRLASDRKVEMLPETRQILADFYRPFTEELALVLDDKRFLWKPSKR